MNFVFEVSSHANCRSVSMRRPKRWEFTQAVNDWGYARGGVHMLDIGPRSALYSTSPKSAEISEMEVEVRTAG